ncbi:MAG: phenylalanine--tRNA ligase beta subunit-related protein [Blastocatellia bacterium]
MMFRITEHIFDLYPEALVGIVVAREINNRGEQSEITELLRHQEARIIEEFAAADIARHPCIAGWREAYRKFGAKPQKYHSSVESLLRRVLSGQRIPNINRLVNIYNAISLKYIIPAGGEDLDRIQGSVELTIAGDAERAILLLGERDERPPKKGEVFYKDDLGGICRRWNWREADRTKLTESTSNALLVVEALNSGERDTIERAINELVELIRVYCGGTVWSRIADKTDHAIELL